MKFCKKLLALVLSATLLLTGCAGDFTIRAQAYSRDYNYIDNLFAEDGLVIPLKDGSTVKLYDNDLKWNGRYTHRGMDRGGANFKDYAATFYVISSDYTADGYTYFIPMTKEMFIADGYNLSWAFNRYKPADGEQKPDTVSNEGKAFYKNYLSQIWDGDSYYSSPVKHYNLTSAKTWYWFEDYYSSTYYYGKNGNSGIKLLMFNNPEATEVTVTVDHSVQLADYCFAKCSVIKSLKLGIGSGFNHNSFTFPTGFCYDASSLLNLSYDFSGTGGAGDYFNYYFEDFSFARCRKLIHITGQGTANAANSLTDAPTGEKRQYWSFLDYAFAECSALSQLELNTNWINLGDYAFGKSGLTKIGIYDYELADEAKYRSKFEGFAQYLMNNNDPNNPVAFSDKAFDGVSATKIYCGNSKIYDYLNAYSDGKIGGLTLCSSNIDISFDEEDKTSGTMKNITLHYDDSTYLLENKYKKTGFSFKEWTDKSTKKLALKDKYNAIHENTDWNEALNNSDNEGYRGKVTLKPVWEAKSYAIHYVLNGGTIGDDAPDKYVYGEAVSSLPEPERVGYDFKGWYEDAGLTKEFSGISATDTGEKTYYAKWQVHIIKITYDLNLKGAANDRRNPTALAYTDGKTVLYPASLEGYTFLGWQIEGTEEIVDSITPAMEDITLVAQWEKSKYAIHYVLNDGTFGEGVDVMEYHVYGESVTELPVPERVGYDFKGWYEDAGLTKGFGGISAIDQKEHTYYAAWAEHQITITYVLNGGTNSESNPHHLSYSDGRVYLQEAKREAYDFKGWYPNGGDTPVTYVTAAMGDLVLEARWEKESHPITYVLNGGDASDIELPEKHIYGEAVTTLPEPKRAGYTFEGWYEDADFSIAFSGISEYDRKEYTFYAKWSEAKQVITYVLNGGQNNINNPHSLAPDAKRFDLYPASREGYTFIGWFLEDLQTEVTYVSPASGSITLYAVWESESALLHYELNGGDASGIELPEKHNYGETITELPEPKRAGYDFRGWYEDKYFTKEFSGITAIDTMEHTYYAKWEWHVVTVSYELDGGTNHPDNPKEITYDAGKIYLKPASKTGYDFAYWYVIEDSDKEKVVDSIIPANGDIKLLAKYTPHTYSISYECSGGVFTDVPVKEHTFGTVTYLVTPIKRDKFYFEGWYSDQNLKNRVYDIAASYAGDITLYAKWAETVGNLIVPEKKGYRFIGWVTGKGKAIKETETVYSHEHDVYASYLDIRWTIKKKGTKPYIKSLKDAYAYFKKKDLASQYDVASDESLKIYGAVNGLVTKKNVKLNIDGAVKALTLKRNGKKIALGKKYFKKKASGEYFKGKILHDSGIYTLSVTSKTGKKLKIKFMIDHAEPVLKGVVKKTVITKTVKKVEVAKKNIKKQNKKVNKKKSKKKGSTTTVTETTTKYKDKSLVALWKQDVKTVTRTKKIRTFKISQMRRFYIKSQKVDIDTGKKNETKTKLTKITASIEWSDSPVGISTVYINGKKLSDKTVAKGSYQFTKAGTYQIKAYDYIGNKFVQKVVIDKSNSDVTLPTASVADGKTYYVGAALRAYDKGGIQSIVVTDYHGFKKKVDQGYQFKKAGTYKIKITDKAGNYRTLKIKIIKKKLY